MKPFLTDKLRATIGEYAALLAVSGFPEEAAYIRVALDHISRGADKAGYIYELYKLIQLRRDCYIIPAQRLVEFESFLALQASKTTLQ